MALVFGDEQVVPYLKFNAKEKKWFINDEAGEIVEIDPPKLLMDLEHIRLGWFRFREGEAPDIVFDPPGREAMKPEAGDHKRGFQLNVYSRDHGVREMASNSFMFKTAIKTLYSMWEKQKDRHPGKLPAVMVIEHTGVQGKYGLNYRPEFAITSWHERPEEFPVEERNDAEFDSAGQTAPATTAKVVEELDDEIPY